MRAQQQQRRRTPTSASPIHRPSPLRKTRRPRRSCCSLVRLWTWLVIVFGLVVWIWLYHWTVVQAVLQGPKHVVNHVSTPKSAPKDPTQPRAVRTTPFTGLTRAGKQQLEAMKIAFESLQYNQRLQPCQLDRDCVESVSTLSFFSTNASPKLLLYNPLPEDRFFCGKRIISSGGTLELTQGELRSCQHHLRRSHLFSSHPPPVSAKGMPPVELFWQNYREETDSDQIFYSTKEFLPCSIPCRKSGEFELLAVISIKGTPWEVLSTMEGPMYYSQAKVRQGSWKKDQYYATTSFQSEIPLPYFSAKEYHIQHPAVDFHKAIKGASFLANNCNSHNQREDWVVGLQQVKGLRIDSLSSCLHNMDAPFSMENKTDVQSRYLFHLAFENQDADDCITEKLWGALASGTLPVYLGAPNIHEHVPPNSVIVARDYETPQALGQYLVRLLSDQALYESHHAWRYQRSLDPVFANKYAFTETHSTCRMCSWAYAKQHGLGWNHSTQRIEEPKNNLVRKTCRNKLGLVGHPFKEYWSLSTTTALTSGNHNKALVPRISSEVADKTCQLTDDNRLVSVGDESALERRVYNQDGVTDLVITSSRPPNNNGEADVYLLKLESPIVSSGLERRQEFESGGAEWWLQDGTSRMTLVISETLEVSLVKDGTVQIMIPPSVVVVPLRIRVVFEDLDLFHKGAKKHANYFGDLMTRDFCNPVQAFKVL